MYHKKDDLSQLISALSKAEKKCLTIFFTIFPKRQKRNYMQLLEFIQKKSPHYKSSLEGSLKTKINAKRRLYDNIMRSLRHHHDTKSIDIIIQNLLSEIEILYDLCLPEQAFTALQRAYLHASKYEKHGLLLQIIEWERKLNLVLDKPSRSNETIEQEEQHVLEKLNQVIAFRNIFSKVKEIKNKLGYIKNLCQEKIKLDAELLPLQNVACLSQKAYFYYHLIHALYYWMLFQHKDAYTHSKQLLAPKIQLVLPNECLDGIFEHITSCVCSGYFEEALSCMDLADQFIHRQRFDQSNSFLLQTFFTKILYKLLIYSYMGAVEKLSTTVQEAEEKLYRYDTQFSTVMKQLIYANLMIAYVTIDQVEKTEEIIEDTLRKGHKLIRKDIYDGAVFFRLFILLYTETYILLPSAALSAQRYYKQFKKNKNELYDTEYKIAKLLQKEHDYGNEQTKRIVLKEIKQILKKSLAATTGLNNFQEYYTQFIIWTDSMLNKRKFHEEAAEWYRQYRLSIKVS